MKWNHRTSHISVTSSKQNGPLKRPFGMMSLNSVWCSHSRAHGDTFIFPQLYFVPASCVCFPNFRRNVLFIRCIINDSIDSTGDKGLESPQSLQKVQPIKMLLANAPVNEYERTTTTNVYWLLNCTFSSSLAVFLINESRVLTRMEAVIKFKCEIRMCAIRSCGRKNGRKETNILAWNVNKKPAWTNWQIEVDLKQSPVR